MKILKGLTLRFIQLAAISYLLILNSCNNGKINLTDYYLPVDELKQAKIYVYKALGNNFPTNFWYYKSYEKDGTSYLESQSFDVRMQVTQRAIEKRVKTGMLLESNSIYLQDSASNQKVIPVEALQKNIFPFSVTDTNGIFIYSVKWSIKPGTHNTVTRNRRFLGFENREYKGKQVKCAKFELKELIEDYNEGYLEYKAFGVEYYAENIGLIYEKVTGDNLSFGYELQNILTLDEFEKHYKTSFKPIK